MVSLLMFGFLLGIRHALEADHIATVASLASTHPSRRQMLRQGLAWGLGHSLTLLLVAGVVLWIDVLVPERLAAGLEMVVGAMMVLLGIDVARRALQSHFHFHAHRHGDGPLHFHAHSHSDRQLQQHHLPQAHRHQHTESFPLRALLMGLIHGMAGSAVLILLFIDRIDSVLQGLLYVVTFSAGSIAGMMLFSVVISIPLVFTAKKLTSLHRGLQLCIGLLTSGVGLLLLVEQL